MRWRNHLTSPRSLLWTLHLPPDRKNFNCIRTCRKESCSALATHWFDVARFPSPSFKRRMIQETRESIRVPSVELIIQGWSVAFMIRNSLFFQRAHYCTVASLLQLLFDYFEMAFRLHADLLVLSWTIERKYRRFVVRQKILCRFRLQWKIVPLDIDCVKF